MTTGQGQIALREGNALDSDGVANVATNAAEFERVSVDDKDIYPNAVWTKHLFAEDGIFAGLLKAGSILVGPDGVAITSDPAGGEPTTGVYIGASVIELKNGGAALVTLDGTDGSFDIRSSATAARVQIDASGIVLYNSAGSALLTLSDAGTFDIRSAASGARVQMDANGINVYNSSGDIKTILSTNGLDIKNESGDSPAEPEQISFKDSSGNIEGYIYYNHTTHKLSFVNTPGGGSVTKYMTLADNSDVIEISSDAAINIDAGTDCTLGIGASAGDTFTVYRGDNQMLWTDDTPELHWDSTPGTAGGSYVISRNIQTGTCTLSDSGWSTVSFGHTFTSAPNVYLTVVDATAGVIVAKAKDVTTTQFSGTIGGSSGFSNINVHWMAVL